MPAFRKEMVEMGVNSVYNASVIWTSSSCVWMLCSGQLAKVRRTSKDVLHTELFGCLK